MSPRQILVLGAALAAAIGALFIVNNMGSRAASAPPTQQVAGRNVLVAARDIPQGAALTSADLRYARFPESAVSQHFIVGAESGSLTPEAELGAVTRRPFVAGEPITKTSIIQPEGQGFFAAQLPPGYRAVAVKIDTNTASGGYIQPNDRVDVVLTHKVALEGPAGKEEVRSDILLEDVRVLALDDHFQPQTAGTEPERITADVAVLELSADDARIVELADALGTLSLALRGVETEDGQRAASKLRRGTTALDQNVRRDTVRVHAFGAVAGGGN